MKIEQEITECLAEARALAEKNGCNVGLTSVWVFTEEDQVKYMVQSFYGEEIDMCIRSNVENNWPDAIISFYKNIKDFSIINATLNNDESGF